MYYSNLSPSQDFVLYKNLLDDYFSEEKTDEVRRLFVDVIVSTHNLIIGSIKRNDVDHKIFNLVVALSDIDNKANEQYFKEINPNSVGDEQLQTLNSILSSLTVTP